MSADKKDYPGVGVGAPNAPTYPGGPGSARPTAMTSPYPGYPATAFTSPGYLQSTAPTYLPGSLEVQHTRPIASYGSPVAPPLHYGAVTPGVTAYGVPPTYLQHITPMYTPRPAAVYIPAAYDAGARFDGHGMPVVPPPPPGVAPNAAQLAMMQGSSMVLGQQKSNFLTGGSGGGYTYW